MYNFIVILTVVVAVLLVFTVIIQNSKGGGLSSGFSSVNQVMGVRKTIDLFEKVTLWLAGIFVALCMVSGFFISRKEKDSLIKDDIIKTIPQQQHGEGPSPFSPKGMPGQNDN